MKPKTILSILAFCLLGIGLSYAQDAFSGTWKLDKDRSIIPAGAQTNTSVTYETAGDSTKITVDGTDGDGKPTHSEWTGKFDGKYYAVSGDPNSDTREYTKVNDRLLRFAVKKAGHVTTVGRVGVAPDGKSRTVTATVINADGKKVSTTSVYEKQEKQEKEAKQ